MSQEIENHVKACKTCEKFSIQNTKEEMLRYQTPQRPWERVGVDIFTYGNQSYLVVYDTYSNWLECNEIYHKSGDEVVKQLKLLFSRFGIPDIVSCDNVPFGSIQMKMFAKEWGFEIRTRSPNYPQSNGLAERGVGITKNLIKKAKYSGRDVQLALLEYRNIPLKDLNLSPSQLLMHRICKTKLPSTIQVLKPKINENVIEKLQLRQEQNTKYYNRSFKNLPTLKPNTNVIIRDPVSNQWNPGKVIEQANKPRSYNVLNDRRHTIQRNRKHLKLSLNQPTIKDEESFECLNPSSKRG
ncbi:hypothetical protein QE152_g19768 [Popillia japonica]|uniref:Integrase catalytic domain-containing protein n=1 Tax=Popillia japonica TaxID=7064 RepID=A0AAW1KQ36_POPJA